MWQARPGAGQNVNALLLHDVVPGGTGYLTDFTDPGTVWDLLHRAWQVVRDCPCQHDGRLACERCLLPFTRDVKRTSRAVAERHLSGLLAGREVKVGEPHEVPDEMPWTITLEEVGDDDPESNLEKRFRVVLAERLKALGATVVEKPSHNGVAWNIALGPTNRWTLRPQEYVLGCQPDFVLTSAQGGCLRRRSSPTAGSTTRPRRATGWPTTPRSDATCATPGIR
jgi:hypothetical protein